jgi:hypothetical protein
VRVAAVALVALGALSFGAQVVWDRDELLLGDLLFVAGVALLVLVPPKATRTRVAIETAWARSLPFAMDGYLELLGGEPHATSVVVVELTWGDPRSPGGMDELRGRLGVLDAEARLEARDDATAVIHSGSISGRTGIRLNRAYVVNRNTRFVGWVHGLVEQALVPLHGSHPVARIALRRT